MEDKRKILNLLLPALQATRNLSDLVSLQYVPEKDIVAAYCQDSECSHGFRYVHDPGCD